MKYLVPSAPVGVRMRGTPSVVNNKVAGSAENVDSALRFELMKSTCAGSTPVAFTDISRTLYQC
jgi:hypothetical protein